MRCPDLATGIMGLTQWLLLCHIDVEDVQVPLQLRRPSEEQAYSGEQCWEDQLSYHILITKIFNIKSDYAIPYS